MKYEDYQFTKEDLAYYNTLHDNKHPYNYINRLQMLFEVYRPKMKKSTIQLADHFAKKDINIYEEAMKWFLNSSYKHKEVNIFELIAIGIDLGKINGVNNIEHSKYLDEIYNIKNNSTSKYLFENKFVILKELIRNDIKYIDILPEFLMTYDAHHNFDVPMKKKVENYVLTLPINLDKYPQLTQLYQSLHEKNYLEIEHHEIYKIKIDSNVIANKYKRSTKDIQNQLIEALNSITSLLLTQEVLNDKNNFNFIKFTRELELTTKIDADLVVKDAVSYQILEKNLNLVIPEIIEGIINKKPYEKEGIKQLMKNLYLYEKLQNKTPVKENMPSKLKI